MRKLLKGIIALLIPVAYVFMGTGYAQDIKTDPVAENMLLFQRSVGGWPKAVNEKPVNYNRTLSESERKSTLSDAGNDDATMDNNATHKEIVYLINAYKQTNNPAYLQSVEKGIRYLLKAQNSKGGWPQYYPDTKIYRAEITFNDNAMINTLNVLFDVAHRINNFDLVDPALAPKADAAVKKGITCILNTQIKVNGKLTAWCQQYNQNTLEPAPARKFELVGITASESVGIVEFLMRIENPSTEIKNAIISAVEWFNKSKIVGQKFEHIADPSQPKGKNAVIVADPNSTIWARYYDIDTNRPFFSGRNSVKVFDITQIENERRTGYAWYGTWPQKVLDKEYPKWLKNNKITN